MRDKVCDDGTDCDNDGGLECETHLEKIKAEPMPQCKSFILQPLLNGSIEIPAMTVVQQAFPKRFQHQQQFLIQLVGCQRGVFQEYL